MRGAIQDLSAENPAASLPSKSGKSRTGELQALRWVTSEGDRHIYDRMAELVDALVLETGYAGKLRVGSNPIPVIKLTQRI